MKQPIVILNPNKSVGDFLEELCNVILTPGDKPLRFTFSIYRFVYDFVGITSHELSITYIL